MIGKQFGEALRELAKAADEAKTTSDLEYLLTYTEETIKNVREAMTARKSLEETYESLERVLKRNRLIEGRRK